MTKCKAIIIAAVIGLFAAPVMADGVWTTLDYPGASRTDA